MTLLTPPEEDASTLFVSPESSPSPDLSPTPNLATKSPPAENSKILPHSLRKKRSSKLAESMILWGRKN